jgi:hypothetical protein
MPADKCEVCGEPIRAWQRWEEFDVGTLIGSTLKVWAHSKCATLKNSTAIHMRSGHKRTMLCSVLGCAN